MKLLNKPVFWIVFFILVNSILVATSPLLPFVDLPNHLAEATIFKYFGSSGNQFSVYYQLVPWYFPNQFHIWFCSLDIFSSVEAGNKAFYILYIILLPTSIYLIVKELGGNLWFSLLSFTLVYGYNVTFGFAGYTIAIPVVFYLFYFMILDYKRPGVWLKVVHSILLILLFTMHAQVALFGGLIYGACALYKNLKSFANLFLAFVVTLPVIFLIVNWWTQKNSQEETDTLGYLLTYYSSTYFQEFFERLGLVAYENFQLREGVLGILIALFFTLLLLLPISVKLKTFFNNLRKGFLKDQYIYVSILLLVSFACYFFLPDELPGQSPISQRFSIFFWLSFILFGSLYLPRFSEKLSKFYIVLAVTVYSLFWTDYMISFNSINQDFNETLFAGIDNDKRLSGLIYDYKFRGRSTYMHFQNYYIVWNKGIASTKIIDYRFGIINRNVTKEVLPEHYDWSWEQSEFLENLPYQNVDLLLVKGEYPTKSKHLNSFFVVEQEGKWELFQNQNDQNMSAKVLLQEELKSGNINE